MAAEALNSSEVKSSMLTYMTTWGVDDWLFVLNVSLAIFITTAMRFYTWAVVALALHFCLMLVTRISPNILECYLKHMKQADRYSPFFNVFQKRGLRPAGFLRNEL
jgi:type IV secretory pathway VirB3-like protein